MSTENPKKFKNLIIRVVAEEMERIKAFCESEGLYLGRFMVKCAIRHIEQVEHERIQKRLKEIL